MPSSTEVISSSGSRIPTPTGSFRARRNTSSKRCAGAASSPTRAWMPTARSWSPRPRSIRTRPTARASGVPCTGTSPTSWSRPGGPTTRSIRPRNWTPAARPPRRKARPSLPGRGRAPAGGNDGLDHPLQDAPEPGGGDGRPHPRPHLRQYGHPGRQGSLEAGRRTPDLPPRQPRSSAARSGFRPCRCITCCTRRSDGPIPCPASPTCRCCSSRTARASSPSATATGWVSRCSRCVGSMPRVKFPAVTARTAISRRPS